MYNPENLQPGDIVERHNPNYDGPDTHRYRIDKLIDRSPLPAWAYLREVDTGAWSWEYLANLHRVNN